VIALLKPIKSAKQGRPVSTDKFVPAPIGGWNARDPEAAMAPGDARELINWFPRRNSVVARNGYARHANTGTGQPVETLIGFHHGTISRLLACSAGSVFDVSAASLGPAIPLRTGLSSSLVSHTKMGGWAICVTGTDVPFVYDGTTISNHQFTLPLGVSLDFTKLSFATTYRSRLYFVERGTQKFWYGQPEARAGKLEPFDLATTGTFKGELLFITCLTQDAGSYGQDDLFLAVFSEGDVCVYQGSNPGNMADWSRIGIYKLGAPLSRFAHIEMGGDVIIATERGYESITRSIKEGEALRQRTLLSDKITTAVTPLTTRGRNDHWMMSLYRSGQMLIVQAPAGPARNQHHVQNIDTGAWCRFHIPEATSWSVLNRKQYMGGKSGRVYLFDVGDKDDGKAIKLTSISSWNAFGITSEKKLQMMRVTASAIEFPPFFISVGADYAPARHMTTLAWPNSGPPANWDISHLDVDHWGKGLRTQESWHTHFATGRSLSTTVTSTSRAGLEWSGITYVFEGGTIL
jgi:hypothetical protein